MPKEPQKSVTVVDVKSKQCEGVARDETLPKRNRMTLIIIFLFIIYQYSQAFIEMRSRLYLGSLQRPLSSSSPSSPFKFHPQPARVVTHFRDSSSSLIIQVLIIKAVKHDSQSRGP